jgi:hypothetical protein
MKNYQTLRKLCLSAAASAILLAIPSYGAPVLAITGDRLPYESGDSTLWTAQGWTQSGAYTDVSIRVTVFQQAVGTPNGQGFAFLEKKVASHAVEIDSTTFRFGANSTQDQPILVTLFSGLSLDPGTYYLAMYGEGFWTAEFQPVITAAMDISNVTDTLTSMDGGQTFHDTGNGIFQEFRITGTSVITADAPEPGTLWMLDTALLFGTAFMTNRLVRRSE